MPNWTKEQKQAIDIRNSNILVSASAGSGKTAVLVERIIQRVVNEYLDVDKILVVTFTNASATELKEKILNAIYKSLDGQKDIIKRNHLRNQLKYINRANITTIDAFCLNVVKENFNLLDIDPNIRICEEAQSFMLKSNIMNEVMEEAYETYDETSESFGLYQLLELFEGKEELLIENLLKIYNYIQSFPYPFKWLEEQVEKYNISNEVDLYNTDFGKDIYEDVISEIEFYVLQLESCLSDISGIEDFNKCAEILNQDVDVLKKCIKILPNSWDSLYENLNQVEFIRFNAGKPADTEKKDSIKNLRDDIKKNIEKAKNKIYAKSKAIIEDNQVAYKYIKYLNTIIHSFDEKFKDEKNRLGIAEFNDIMHFALELLVDVEGNITDVAKNYQNRFLEVYTDEYQDTSFVQEAILESVSNGKNRFMVGDIKQSIYRFRQARPEIFNEKYNTYEKYNEIELDNTKVILARNFRSRNKVIDSINYIFDKIMSVRNGECEYSDDERLVCGNESYIEEDNTRFQTEINIINLKEELDKLGIQEEDIDEDLKNNLEELSKVEIEAKFTALKIKDIVKNSKVTNNDGTLRNARYKDIVILFRSVKDKADIFERILKENDIPVFSDSSSSIFDGEEVKFILSFLRVLDNPYQDIYLVSTMYSIIGGFSLDDIAKIRMYNSKKYIYETLINILKDEEFLKSEEILVEKIRKFIDLIEEYIKYSKVYNISQLLIRMYKDTQIYYQFALEEMSDSKKANLNYLIELAEKFYSEQGNTLNSYIKYIDYLKDKQDTSSTSAKIIGENEDVVRIMTIHKSKGLEFPIVILADCAKRYSFKDIQKTITLHHKYGIGINIVNQDYGITYPSAIKQSIKTVIEKEIKSEEIRLFYVALTRAKEKLYLSATTKDYLKDYDEQQIMIEEGKFNEQLILANQSYYKHLVPVIKYYNEKDSSIGLLDINTIDVNSSATTEELRRILYQELDGDENLSIAQKVEKLYKSFDIEENVELVDLIKNRLEYEYKNIEDTKIPARVSVSNLKKQHEQEENIKIKALIEDNEQDIDVEISTNKYDLPESIKEDSEKYSAVRKGILVHFILEHLDFNKIKTKEELTEYINGLVELNVITKNDKRHINVDRIYKFLSSQIGMDLRDNDKVYREYEFILKDEKFSKSEIQGVIDLFYITSDNKVNLVDFKTDRIQNEAEFIRRYRLQLDIYKEAINKLTSFCVDKVYIYSFNLSKMIEI